jgi:hypothetical protein
MKVFLSSAYNDLIEHRIIPEGDKAVPTPLSLGRGAGGEVL